MTDFDPTTNRVPFSLMSEDEQTALIHWPHGWEYYLFKGWCPADCPSWDMGVVYRGKPAPVVESRWINIYPRGTYLTRDGADEFASEDRIAVLRIDTCNGVSTAHLEDVK